MIQIKNVELYAPSYEGKKDLLIGGGKILAIEDSLREGPYEQVDGSGLLCIPGLIDQHVHLTGGGGEGGFATKTPEVQLSKLIEGGVTTVLGLLGTDGYSRSIENLLSKAKALKEEGLSVFCTTGSYGYPSVTLTGSVAKDLMFIEEMIGCKLALSDHRSSHVTLEELIHLASEVRVAGMLAKKAGVLVLHLGDEAAGLQLIEAALNQTDLPISLFRPTHVTRNPQLFKEALRFAKRGGWIDCTCGNRPFAEAYLVYKEAKADLTHLTLSSDGQGSWSRYDEQGRCIEIGVSSVSALHQELQRMVLEYAIPLEEALNCMTRNVAVGLGLKGKGELKEGMDADLLLVSKDLTIDSVMAQGVWMKRAGKLLKKGYYES